MPDGRTKPFLRQAAVLLALALVCGASARAQFESAGGIIGLLPLPELQDSESCARLEARDVQLYERAGGGPAVGIVRVVRRAPAPTDGSCEGRVATALRGAPQAFQDLPMLEAEYAAPAAIVLEAAAPWFRIALPKGSAWIRVDAVDRYRPVEKLLRDRLTYLRTEVSQVLHASADAASPVLAVPGAPPASTNVEILEALRVGDRLWFKVQTLSEEPCSGEPIREPVVVGWTPFHDAAGQPILWFYARGC
jgi:hypothetical protein